MSLLLAIWGILFAVIGVATFAISRSAVDMIEAGLAFLIATVAIGSVGVIEAIKTAAKKKTAEPNV